MGAKRVVARLALSLVGGTALFLGVAVGGGELSTYIEDRALRELLSVTVRWPRYIYYYLSPASSKPSLYFSDTASIVTLIVCNIAFHSLIIYLALWLRSFFKKKANSKELLSTPPPPPNFNE